MKTFFPAANFLDRCLAYIIDILIVIIITQFPAHFFPRFNPTHIFFILNINYFIFCHGNWGYTPGKWIMGLKVVSIDGQLPIFRAGLILRELSRLLVPLTLFIGYLLPLFHAKKQALHDIFGQTIVVQSDGKTHSAGTYLLAFILIMILGVIPGSYFLLFTPLPAQKMVSQLSMNNFLMHGIRGNFFNGYEVAYAELTTQFADVQLHNLKLQIAWDQSRFNKIVVDKVEVESGEINIYANPLWDRFLKQESLDRQLFIPTDTINETTSGSDLQVNIMEINNVQFKIGKEKYLSERNHVSMFVWNDENQSWSFDRVYIDNQFVRIDMGQFLADRQNFKPQRPTYIGMKPKLFGSLKKEQQGVFSFNFSGKTITSINASLFDQRVNMQISPKLARVNIQKFQPNYYLNTPYPLTEISLSAEGPINNFLETSSWFGTIHLGSFPARVNRNIFQLYYGKSQFQGQIVMKSVYENMLGHQVPPLFLSNLLYDNILAEWYFKKSLENLSDSEQKYIQSLYSYFGDTSIRRPAGNTNQN